MDKKQWIRCRESLCKTYHALHSEDDESLQWPRQGLYNAIKYFDRMFDITAELMVEEPIIQCDTTCSVCLHVMSNDDGYAIQKACPRCFADFTNITQASTKAAQMYNEIKKALES